MLFIGHERSRRRLRTDPSTSLGARAIGPVAPVSFTATSPAAQLVSSATSYSAGFVVSNLGAVTMYLREQGGATALGIPVPAGGSVTIASSDASLWYAYAASPCAGCVTGTVGE